MNNLPKSFGVLNDGSKKFDLVKRYLIDTEQYDDDCFATVGNYGGINKKGYPQYGLMRLFSTILTIEQFIEMTKEKQIVYGIKNYNIAERHYKIPFQLYSTKEKAIEELERIVLNENLHAPNEFSKFVLEENHKYTYISCSSILSITEFELI